jgi:hypothetical protein
MSTTQTVRGPFHHRDVFHIDTFSIPTTDCSCEPPRKRHLDAAGIARVAGQQVDERLAPIAKAIDHIASTITRIDTKQRDARAKFARVQAHRDAIADMERAVPPPLGYVRDDVSGEIRPRTTQDDLVASRLHYGRDAGGRRPGEPGYQFDGEAMLKAGASLNEINRAFWSQKR